MLHLVFVDVEVNEVLGDPYTGHTVRD